MSFDTLLIANRGEIAVRIAATAKAMGLTTVAVFSEADRDALHVQACDRAVGIGPAPAAESYLKQDRIVEAALASGAGAIHPGYGFLSENAEFAERVEAAGLVFVGPTADTIRAMGSKAAAKSLMDAAGVPVTPGYGGEDQTAEHFREAAGQIGYPVLLKAVAGGGGKGMRRVDRAEDLEPALAAAKREAESAFGDGRFLLEKYVERARHLEVQVFGNGEGGAVHLFERDCSVQRRHQKVIEEAPAPDLPSQTRDRLLQAGVSAAKAVDYRGAGTVEFLYDVEADAVYFMEMNTRLQVEHPVTECVTGTDLVAWQLRLAQGDTELPDQDSLTVSGHAVEARLYAEDPADGYAPSTGGLTRLELATGDEVRVDSGVREGDEVTPFYDPMIAKLIAHGPSREAALSKLTRSLAASRIAGVETNRKQLLSILRDDDFRAAKLSTRFLDDWSAESDDAGLPADEALAVAAALLAAEASGSAVAGFRLNAPPASLVWLADETGPVLCRVERLGAEMQRVTLARGGDAATLRERAAGADAADNAASADVVEAHLRVGTGANAQVRLGDVWQDAAMSRHRGGWRVFVGEAQRDIGASDPLAGPSELSAAAGSLSAPLPGTVTAVFAEAGQAVKAGEPVAALEAMKMEHTIEAPKDGVLSDVFVRAGDQVKEGERLAAYEEGA